MKKSVMGVAALGAALGVSSVACGQDLSPAAVGSVRDSPRGGAPEMLTTAAPFNTLTRQVASAEDRAMLEFDVSAFAGATLESATVRMRIVVNNAQDNGPRLFNLEVYSGNGEIELSDFDASGTVVGSFSYHPPNQSFVDVSIDATAAVQALLNGGATHVGVRVDPASEPNFPNVIDMTADHAPVLRLVVGAGGGGCGSADFDGDGDVGTDADIEAFFACLAGDCCATCFSGGADFDGDGDVGTDADIEAFFRVLAGGEC
jgi:hypothetical protein